MGEKLHDYANGLDKSPVSPDKDDAKSVGNGMTFRRDLRDMYDVKPALMYLADKVAERLRLYGLKCSTVRVAVKDPAFKSFSRQKTLNEPTILSLDIYKAAERLVEDARVFPIRALTITAAGVTRGEAEQLALFDREKREKYERLEKTVFDIHQRFGKNAVTRGSVLKNDIGLDN
jgi:DNA polymerase-4